MLPTRVLPAAPGTGELSVTLVPGERPGRVVVEVVGEVSASTVPLLQLCLDSRTDQPDLRELVVDLAQATGLEPDGTAALARARRRCARRGARLVLRPAGAVRLPPRR